MRKVAYGILGALALALVYVLGTPAGIAVAQNVACYFAQGGASFTAGSGCTITVASGGILNANSGRVRIATGATPPATCSVGEIFIDTDETVDTNCTTTADDSICVCSATDTWNTAE